MSRVISGTFSAELFTESCSIPELYRIYHGGQEVDGRLVARQEHIWNRVSSHLFFSANRKYVEEEYLFEKMYRPTKENEVDVTEIPRNFFVADARTVPPATLVCVNTLGLWYDDIRTIEDFLAGFKEHKVRTLPELLLRDPDYDSFQFKPYHQRRPALQTAVDFRRQLEQAKQDWFRIYTKQFNIMHLERYRRQDTNVILVPGPILVR